MTIPLAPTLSPEIRGGEGACSEIPWQAVIMFALSPDRREKSFNCILIVIAI